MKLSKKLTSILCAAALLVSALPAAAAVVPVDDNKSQVLMNQAKSLEIVEQIEASVNKDEELKDAYAGVYLDDFGNLVVNYVGNNNRIKQQISKNCSTYANSSNSVTYKEVDNNLVALTAENQKCQNLLGEYGITSIELSISKNCVIVTYQDDSTLPFLYTQFDKKVVQFEKADPEMKAVFTTNILNGNAGSVYPNDTMFTIGCSAKKSSSGAKGVLVPGHLLAPNNTSIYYNGGNTVMGKISGSQFSGGVDASFVQTNSNFTPTLKFADGSSYEYTSVDTGIYGLVEGLNVCMHGYVTSQSFGKVLSTNYSESVNGVSMTGMVKCSYKAIHGDSGAGVTYDRYVGSASSKVSVIGLQSFSFLLNNGEWGDKSYACFSRIDKIFNALGLEDI